MAGAKRRWVITRACMDDAAQISELIHEMGPLVFGNAGTSANLERWLRANASLDAIAKRLADSEVQTLVARDDQNQIAGSGYVAMRTAGTRRHGYIGGLYCRTRGVGLGELLLNELIHEAELDDCAEVRLTVGEDNDAMLRLVNRRDFQLLGAKPDATGIFPSVFFEFGRSIGT
jgi:L-amino acid N-acyltransferase YncA